MLVSYMYSICLNRDIPGGPQKSVQHERISSHPTQHKQKKTKQPWYFQRRYHLAALNLNFRMVYIHSSFCFSEMDVMGIKVRYPRMSQADDGQWRIRGHCIFSILLCQARLRNPMI